MKSLARRWQPGSPRCCNCGCEVTVTRTGDAVHAGAGFLPAVPGVVCPACLELSDGLAITDLRAAAAAHILLAQPFERRTSEAVQAVLDLHGWQPDVVAAGALRLHADGKSRDAYSLLRSAAEHGEDAGFFLVEQAGLRLLDGETGRAHELLLETDEEDHPRWHLMRGNLAASVGRIDAAREHWQQQVQVSPDEPLGWQTLGWHLLHDRQDPAAAAACFSGACRLFPQHQEFRAWLGESLFHQGKAAEALTELEAAQRLDPVDAQFSAGLEALVAEVREAAAAGEG
jgi:tetratricopeptide (TPR) repeat protein